jgi:hypothetical protein
MLNSSAGFADSIPLCDHGTQQQSPQQVLMLAVSSAQLAVVMCSPHDLKPRALYSKSEKCCPCRQLWTLSCDHIH